MQPLTFLCPHEECLQLSVEYGRAELEEHIARIHLSGYALYFCPKCKEDFVVAIKAYDHIRNTCRVQGILQLREYTKDLLQYVPTYPEMLHKLVNQAVCNKLLHEKQIYEHRLKAMEGSARRLEAPDPFPKDPRPSQRGRTPMRDDTIERVQDYLTNTCGTENRSKSPMDPFCVPQFNQRIPMARKVVDTTKSPGPIQGLPKTPIYRKENIFGNWKTPEASKTEALPLIKRFERTTVKAPTKLLSTKASFPNFQANSLSDTLKLPPPEPPIASSTPAKTDRQVEPIEVERSQNLVIDEGEDMDITDDDILECQARSRRCSEREETESKEKSSYTRVQTSDHVCEYEHCCDPKRKEKCVFCSGLYKNEDCAAVIDVNERKAVAAICNGLCHICLTLHSQKFSRCPAMSCKKCLYINHPTSLCWNNRRKTEELKDFREKYRLPLTSQVEDTLKKRKEALESYTPVYKSAMSIGKRPGLERSTGESALKESK